MTLFRHFVGLALILSLALAGAPVAAQTVCAGGGCQIGPCGCSSFNEIADSSFESTTCINWVFSTGASREAKTSFCGNSHRNGLLQENGVNGSQGIYQDVVLPATLVHGAGVSSGELDFTLDIQTAETAGAYTKDNLTVEIRNPSTNAVLQTLTSIDSTSSASYQCGYIHLTLNGSYSPSQTIRVYFRGTFNNNGAATSFRIDNVYLYPNC
jgi:hypothetical protein